MWRSFVRMPHFDLRNLFVELSPWRYAEMHRRNFARFIRDRLHAPDALPCFISVTRLRDRTGLLIDARERSIVRSICCWRANFLPPFYTRTPLILGERFGDGGVSDNAPYELAFEHGCDAVVLVTVKGESEGGIYKSTRDVDHVIPAALRDRVVVIRPRHRLPYAFVERKLVAHHGADHARRSAHARGSPRRAPSRDRRPRAPAIRLRCGCCGCGRASPVADRRSRISGNSGTGPAEPAPQ